MSQPASPPAESPDTSPSAPPVDARTESDATEAKKQKKLRRRKWRRRVLGTGFLLFILLIVVGRILMPQYVLWFVNRTIDQNPLYNGRVGSISIHLYKGEYSINDIKLLKTTGNVPVPFFSAKQVKLAIEWNALLHGKVKGTVVMESPQVNFVEDSTGADSQTGSDGPWLGIIRGLFPFEINSVVLHNGSIHFHAFDRTPQVDVYLSDVEASVEDLTNVRNETKPLISTVTAQATAMESGKVNLKVQFDPFSYKPTFDLALKLIGLNVTKLNDFAKAYGGIDFEGGWFDLVVQLSSKEGELDGNITPLFRHLQIFGPNDLEHDDPLNAFWQALVGGAEFVLQNQHRDQFGTRIPVTGNLDAPKPDILTTIGNVLRNAFIRAYLPRFSHQLNDSDTIQFKPGTILDPGAASMMNP